MNYRRIAAICLSLITLAGCKSQSCPTENIIQTEEACLNPTEGDGALYESWSGAQSQMHAYFGGIDIDPGTPQAAKYLERKGTSPWVAPELITAAQAQKDGLVWASERHVSWLGATQGTVHFPFYPDEWDGDLMVSVELRPKMNASMAVRFYKPDGEGGRTWSDPLTTDLQPGWNGYRWKVPREYLSKDGMQLMRVSFPGSFFEGENRVSAKFVRMSFGPSNQTPGRYKIAPADLNTLPGPKRVLDQTLDSWGIRKGDHLERFFVVPAEAKLRFHAAPSAWLETPGTLHVDIQNDAEKKEVYQTGIKPGDCWKPVEIDLAEYANQGVRVYMHFEQENVETGFAPDPTFRADAWISSPEIRTDDHGLAEAQKTLATATRIVVLSIDNLRADRLWNEEKRRASVHLSRFADDGILGLLMGEGKNYIPLETSFLTGVPAEVHNVRDSATHVRSSLNTLAESIQPQGWKSYFYSTSGLIDSSRGFAQGFDEVRQLNKENITETSAALSEVTRDLEKSDEKSLFFVHLNELRLPHRVDSETMQEWGVPGYTGPVNEAAMNNIAVMQDPSKQDAQQFEAYYDAELSKLDDAIGEFSSTLPDGTLLVIYGTHGNSLGESTLGYEQGLTPWELITPFVLYMRGHDFKIRREGLARPHELSASLLTLTGAELPENTQTVFTLHDSHPLAEFDGMTATAGMNWFYRMKREGVDALFTTGLDGSLAHRDETAHPVTKQALREMIP